MLPKKVTVLGRKYKVKLKDRILVNGSEVSGSCDTVNKEIHIEKGLPLDEQMGILAHEMGHAALVVNGLAETLSDSQCEMLCQIVRSCTEDFVRSFK
jgi:Zn-dependent peptidase ImmA (M78 family)